MSDKAQPKCHVTNGQLKCDRCNHRLRTKAYTDRPFYPYCPWCGNPVSVEAQELEMMRKVTR